MWCINQAFCAFHRVSGQEWHVTGFSYVYNIFLQLPHRHHAGVEHSSERGVPALFPWSDWDVYYWFSHFIGHYLCKIPTLKKSTGQCHAMTAHNKTCNWLSILTKSLLKCWNMTCSHMHNAMFTMAEFGVFVDAYGRRSRTDELKWSRLPLTFGTFVFWQTDFMFKNNVYLNIAQMPQMLSEISSLKVYQDFAASILSLPQPSENHTCLWLTSTRWTLLSFRVLLHLGVFQSNST